MIVVAHRWIFAQKHLLFPILVASVLFVRFLTKFITLLLVIDKRL